MWCKENLVNHQKVSKYCENNCLCIIYKDFFTTSEGLLAKDNSVIIHNQNLQQLAIEIFKVKILIMMKNVFYFTDNNINNLKSCTHLSRSIVRATHYGTTESITNLGEKI